MASTELQVILNWSFLGIVVEHEKIRNVCRAIH
jgi:hypothetical protein